ncbi:hypothetical protein A5707_08385 [Mycobacterium kyorinense]|uniref:Uncharacterized protein n=1 Tax=Mycobacterium kyorinense TaxID=487514 RepID=A0A1A2YRE6_9MYCO|nr:hypothetical protein A5707_08385 [Mycobacterium kyorinense]
MGAVVAAVPASAEASEIVGSVPPTAALVRPVAGRVVASTQRAAAQALARARAAGIAEWAIEKAVRGDSVPAAAAAATVSARRSR